MKRILSITAVICLALMAISCNKENSGNELTVDWSSMALTTITSNCNASEDAVIAFGSASVQKTSEIDGKSHFFAISNGKMAYNAFIIDFYFDNIDRVKVGQTLDISDFSLWFPFSSDSRTTTHNYSGTVSLAKKADDYVVLYFHNVSASCSFGDYVTNGAVHCSLIP